MLYQCYAGGWMPMKSPSRIETMQQAAEVFFGNHELEWKPEPQFSPDAARSWVLEHNGIEIFVVELHD